MTCDVQSLLDEAQCFSALGPNLRGAVMLSLWCDIAEGISNLTNDNPSIQSIDDGLWYRTGGVTIGPGDAIFWMTQTQTAAGPNPYLVIADPDSGDKYKIEAWGVPPNVQWQLDPTPTGDAETPTQISVGGVTYNLVVRQDPGPIPVLEAV